MQLILNTDANIGIPKKMSVIEQESLSLDEKYTINEIKDKIDNVIQNVVENTTIENNLDHSKDIIEIQENESDDVDENEVNIIQTEKSNNNKDVINVSNKHNNTIDTKSNKSVDEESNDKEQKDSIVIQEESESLTLKDKEDTPQLEDAPDSNKQDICEKKESHLEDKINCDDKIKQTDLNLEPQLVQNQELSETNEVFSKKISELANPDVDAKFTMRVKNVSEINENPNENHGADSITETEEVIKVKINNSMEKCMQSDSLISYNDAKNLEKEATQKMAVDIISSDCEKDDEVIDIVDEKDEECVAVIDNETSSSGKESENIIINTEDSINSPENVITDADNVNDAKNNTNDDITLDEVEINEVEGNEIKEQESETCKEITAEESLPTSSPVTEKKTLLHISKLSNTLDILSDDEEEEPKPESKVQEPEEKQCINIEDDEDIMLIDEEIPCDDSKKDISVLSETDTQQNDDAEQSIEDGNEMSIDLDKSDGDLTTDTKSEEKEIDTDLKEEKLQEHVQARAPPPLVPVTFLKSCKKNLAEMTREELEEFCVLRIVESIVDRSNLSEMNQQLQSMSQNIEEFKKKTHTLMKQNRDLQVVLKSIQEEQKKNSGQPITPLKITRSVGMQVLMIETPALRKKSAPGNKFPNNGPNSLKNKNQPPNQSPKPQKVPTNTNQQIPVPRLVPAVNNNNATSKAQTSTPTSPKVQGSVPNGVRMSPPATKPEKRSFGKMQQGNSITVDLTDDEPPSKMTPRNVPPPVRLVSQQSLLTKQGPQFINAINSPRKVYITISGSQTQVRPGQTIMLKQCPPQGGPRLRGPTVPKSPNAMRLPRIAAKHPAPLPDDRKQYQPPNWKALPPAPELKLSKVENGIVISWKIDGYQEENHEEIASYQLYAYQETTSPPNTALWKKIGDVKALPLPMACTLTQFMAGYKYYFAVRAVDVRSRLGPFSLPGSILLLNKM